MCERGFRCFKEIRFISGLLRKYCLFDVRDDIANSERASEVSGALICSR